MRSSEEEELSALTGLRFGAAALILIAHLRGQFEVPSDFLGGVPLENGVSFFFVLSGFILTHVYRRLASVEDRRRFYLARFARIWPLHVACIILVYVFLGSPTRVGTYDTLPIGLLNLALLQAWIPQYQTFFSYNAVSWSLSVEAFFYALFPVIIWRFRKHGGLWVLGSVLAICVLALIARAADAGPFDTTRANFILPGFMYVNPAARLLEFVAGIGTAHIWIASRGWLNGSRARANVVQLLAVLAIFLAYYFAHFAARQFRLAGSIELAEWVRVGGATFLASAFLIYAFAANRGFLRAIFASPILVYLGRISFAIYLFHLIPINVRNLNPERFAAYENLSGLVIVVAFVIVMSAALHHLVEEPCRCAITGRRRRRATSIAPA